MDPNDLYKAIKKLKPTAQFSFSGNDYTTIKWDILEGEAPTKAELDAAIEEVKSDEAQAESDKATKKAGAEAKLVALGLTAEDLRVLGI